MPYWVYFVTAHWGIKDERYERVTDLQIMLDVPDEQEALRQGRQLAPGRPEYTVRQVIQRDPRRERPEAFLPAMPYTIRELNGYPAGLLNAGQEG